MMTDIYVLVKRGYGIETERVVFTSINEKMKYIDDMCREYPNSTYNYNELTLSIPYESSVVKSSKRMPEDIFKECAEIMGGKRHDYTAGPAHENFERSATIASWFRDQNDKVYVTLIAIKLARLATLLGNKNPRNESIRDTFKDLINYSALWADSRDERDEIEVADSPIGPSRITYRGIPLDQLDMIKILDKFGYNDLTAIRDYIIRLHSDRSSH